VLSLLARSAVLALSRAVRGRSMASPAAASEGGVVRETELCESWEGVVGRSQERSTEADIYKGIFVILYIPWFARQSPEIQLFWDGGSTCNAWHWRWHCHWHWHWLARQRHARMSRNAATGQLTQPALFRFARLAERDSQQERGTGIGEDRGEQLLLLPTEDRRFPQLRIRAMSRATLVALAWRCWCAIWLAYVAPCHADAMLFSCTSHQKTEGRQGRGLYGGPV
jgi:hypothetical protein